MGSLLTIVNSLYIKEIGCKLSTFSNCLPELVVSLASLKKATGPKLTKLISSPLAYLVLSLLKLQILNLCMSCLNICMHLLLAN